jgi:hypothetical protein
MKRYLAGAAIGAALVLLLGVSGDDSDLAKQVATMQKDFTLRMAALESRVAALERKAAAPASTPSSTTPTTPAAAGPVEEPADDGVDLAQARTFLRTALYEEIDGLTDLWLSPLEHKPGGDPKRGQSVTAVGKLHFIGADDLKDFELRFQIIYRNKLGRHIGMSEFIVAGERLKDRRYYTFRQVTDLSEEYVYGATAKLVYLTKRKITSSSSGGYPR